MSSVRRRDIPYDGKDLAVMESRPQAEEELRRQPLGAVIDMAPPERVPQEVTLFDDLASNAVRVPNVKFDEGGKGADRSLSRRVPA